MLSGTAGFHQLLGWKKGLVTSGSAGHSLACSGKELFFSIWIISCLQRQGLNIKSTWYYKEEVDLAPKKANPRDAVLKCWQSGPYPAFDNGGKMPVFAFTNETILYNAAL